MRTQSFVLVVPTFGPAATLAVTLTLLMAALMISAAAPAPAVMADWIVLPASATPLASLAAPVARPLSKPVESLAAPPASLF